MQDKIAELEAELDSTQDDRARVALLNEIAYRLRAFDAPRSIAISEEAHALALKIGDQSGIAASLLGIGFGKMIRGEYSECLELSLDSLRRSRKIGDCVGVGRAGIYLGLIYRSLGNLDKSFEHYATAHKILSDPIDTASEELRKDGLAWCLFGMAGVQEALNDLDLALDYYEQSLALFCDIALSLGESRALTGIASVHRARGEYDQALARLKRSLALDTETQMLPGLARTYTDIGDCLEATGRIDEALEYNERALALREENELRDAATTNRMNIGRILIGRGELDRALDYLGHARAEAESLQVRPKLFRIHALLADVHERRGDFRVALEHFREYHRLEREVYSDESSSRIKNIQIDNEVEIAEKEAEIQRLRNVELAALNEQLHESNEKIQQEKEHSDRLLHNILPAKIVHDLRTSGATHPETFDDVTVFFSDFIGFTSRSATLEPAVLIAELNEIFTRFDEIAEDEGCERIKTIGDAYLAVCGMPRADGDHATKILRVAQRAVEYLEQRNRTSAIEWPVRIGVHSGRVVGGVVGVKKYIYDVFGDTINTASRMESHSAAMRINVSESTYRLTKNDFPFERRQSIDVKGKGAVQMYFLQQSTTR